MEENLQNFLNKGIHVICDKPMTATIEDAYELIKAIKSSNAHFFLTHNYSGYPVIREMRSLVKNGELGNLRIVKGAYLQGWLGSREEGTGTNKQAEVDQRKNACTVSLEVTCSVAQR